VAHEIFISYSSKHRDLTRGLAAVIEAQYGAGSVWWDHALESWGEYEPQIRNALNRAKAVVVIWTQDAVQSNWVRAEADEADRVGKLVHVRAPEIYWREMPPEYSRHHVKELDDADGILRSIATVWQGTLIRTELPLHEIYFRQHGHRIIDPKRRSLGRGVAEISPTELLQAKYQVVPFVDDNDTKAQLLAWCVNAGRVTAGRLVYGPGGLGKTRLMIDVATALRGQGWTAGFLDRPHEQIEATLKLRQQALDQLIDHGEDHGLLIVLDYAEGRPDEIKSIAQRLANRTPGMTRPIRLVLLTRSAGEWWTTLHDETPDVEKLFRRDGRAADVMALPPINTGAQRLKLFVKSVEALAPLMHAQGFVLPTSIPPQPDVARLARIETGETNTRPLAIQMEALLYLASATPDAVGVDALLRKVLGIERDHWKKLLGSLDDDHTRDMSRAVAQVTVVRGVTGGLSAERLLMADDFYKGQRTARVSVDPVLRNLTRVYGTPDGGIAYLEPDLIGEHHVASLADVELIEGCLRWISSQPDVEQHNRRRDLLTVLQRATQPEHGTSATKRAAELLNHIILQHGEQYVAELVAVAVDTTGALAQILVDVVDRLPVQMRETIAQRIAKELIFLRKQGFEQSDPRVQTAQYILSAYPQYSTIPVYICSTFADMQAERDHLRMHVFPALEERLRAHRRFLEWVDLRVGVEPTASLEDEQQRERQVLKVCLAEVRRCRPFLVVLLGDRYGWVPPADRIASATREVRFDGEHAGRSVTDLEIRFGVLSNPEQETRSFFYFREPLPYAAMPPDIAALYSNAHNRDPGTVDHSQRLVALKGEIQTRFPDKVRRYTAGWDSERNRVTSLDQWGQAVLEDVWSQLAAATASSKAQPELTWQQVERNALDDYVEDRARDFVGRAQVLARLQALASAPPQPGGPWALCLTGVPGSGKSAIFSFLHRRLSNTFVLAHAAGASARGPSVEAMLRRWIEELGVTLGVDPGLGQDADPDTIETTFHGLLERMAGQRRVVVLVDALDRFEATTRGRFMTWLPRVWPTNARLIATAISGEASKALAKRDGAETMSLPPLDAIEARAIAERICARYNRKLEPAVLDALLARTGKDGHAWGNALWLVLAVEQLILVDADDFARAMRTYAGAPAEQLRALMLDIVAELPADVLGLYAQTFERVEKLFDLPLSRAFLGFIAISRAGWRENDLRVLLPRASGEPWDELRFAALRRLFRGHVRQRVARGSVAQWDFNHAQMRAAVRHYLAAHSVTEAEFHAEVVEHLLALHADDPLRQSETMVHLLGSEDWQRAGIFYGAASLTDPELQGATRVLADAILTHRGTNDHNGVEQVLRLLNAATNPQTAGTIGERFMFNLDALLADLAEPTDRFKLLRDVRITFERLAKADPANASWQRDVALSYGRVAWLQAKQGARDEAIAGYRRARDIVVTLKEQYPNNATLAKDLTIFEARLAELK